MFSCIMSIQENININTDKSCRKIKTKSLREKFIFFNNNKIKHPNKYK